MNRKVIKCKNCKKKYEITHTRSITKYPKMAKTALEDRQTRDMTHDGVMYITGNEILRCISRGHSLAVAEVDSTGRTRYLKHRPNQNGGNNDR